MFEVRPSAIIRYFFDEDESFTKKLVKNKTDMNTWKDIVSIFYYVIMHMSIHSMTKVCVLLIIFYLTALWITMCPCLNLNREHSGI